MWPGGARCGLTWRSAELAVAGNGLMSPRIWGRWLPVRLPAISLATLMFECSDQDGFESRVPHPAFPNRVGPQSAPARPSAAVAGPSPRSPRCLAMADLVSRPGTSHLAAGHPWTGHGQAPGACLTLSAIPAVNLSGHPVVGESQQSNYAGNEGGPT